jgi:hypothetical protein
MDRLEQELKAALSRKDPPAGFAERVVRASKPVHQWPRWLAAAAAGIMIAAAGVGYREYRGEIAKEQVMQAMKIAATKVNRIQNRVREAGQ